MMGPGDLLDVVRRGACRWLNGGGSCRLRIGARIVRRLLGVHLVQALCEALGAAAVVDEDDRRGVLADQGEQLRVDGRPDAAGGRVAGDGPGSRGVGAGKLDSVRISGRRSGT